MKYGQVNGEIYHFSDIFAYLAIDKNGDIYAYQEKPFVRLEEGYWTGGYLSHDFLVYQANDEEYCKDWVHSLQVLT